MAHEEVLNFCQSVLPFVPIFTYCSCVDSQPCVHCHVIFESPRLFNLCRWISRMDCNFEGHILGHRDCIFLGQGNFYNVYIALDRNNLWYACPVIRIQIQPFWNFFFDEFGSRYPVPYNSRILDPHPGKLHPFSGLNWSFILKPNSQQCDFFLLISGTEPKPYIQYNATHK